MKRKIAHIRLKDSFVKLPVTLITTLVLLVLTNVSSATEINKYVGFGAKTYQIQTCTFDGRCNINTLHVNAGLLKEVGPYVEVDTSVFYDPGGSSSIHTAYEGKVTHQFKIRNIYGADFALMLRTKNFTVGPLIGFTTGDYISDLDVGSKNYKIRGSADFMTYGIKLGLKIGNPHNGYVTASYVVNDDMSSQIQHDGVWTFTVGVHVLFK